MELSYATFVLYHYGRRYIERVDKICSALCQSPENPRSS